MPSCTSLFLEVVRLGTLPCSLHPMAVLLPLPAQKLVILDVEPSILHSYHFDLQQGLTLSGFLQLQQWANREIVVLPLVSNHFSEPEGTLPPPEAWLGISTHLQLLVVLLQLHFLLINTIMQVQTTGEEQVHPIGSNQCQLPQVYWALMGCSPRNISVHHHWSVFQFDYQALVWGVNHLRQS